VHDRLGQREAKRGGGRHWQRQGLWHWWAIAKRVVWPDTIVMSSLCLDKDLGFGKALEDFKQKVVRNVLTGGLSRRRVADRLGLGLSILGKWNFHHLPTNLVSAAQVYLAGENERLRLENLTLKEQGRYSKKLPSSLRPGGSEVSIRAQLPPGSASGDALPRDTVINARLSVLARTAGGHAVT
jgi:transposase-like protein